MGQKVSPIGLRLGINKTWSSRWFEDSRTYADSLHEDTVPAVASICQDSVMRQSGRYMSVTDSVCSRVTEQ